MSSKSTAPKLDVGSLLDGRYRLLGEIGEGGMGRVYEAYDETRAEMVAVKVMSPKWANDEKARARFLREVDATKRIRHPNVVGVYGAGFCDEERNRPYLAMERLYGVSLWHYVHCPVQGHGPMDLELAVDLMEQAAGALEASHEAGVIHRDVKPENFLLSRGPNDEPILKLLDFGLVQVEFAESKLTEEGTFVGTPEYMAPELAFGREASPHTDVYGLASAFYEMVTGKMAFSGKTHFEIISKKQKNLAPTLEEGAKGKTFPPAVEAVIAKALSRDPEDRQPNPTAFAAELKAALHGAEAKPNPNPRSIESGPRRRAPALPPESVPLHAAGDRRRRRIGIAALFVLAVAAGMMLAYRTNLFSSAEPVAENEPPLVAAAPPAPMGETEEEPLIDLNVDDSEAEALTEEPPVDAVPAEVAAAEPEVAPEPEPQVAVAPRARRAERRAPRPDLAAIAARAEAVADEAPAPTHAAAPAERNVNEPLSEDDVFGAPAAATEPAVPAEPAEDTEEPADAPTVDVAGSVSDAIEGSSLDEIDLERNLI